MMARMFRIDLREIEGEGEFLCPTCGELISPDDESGLAYEVLDITKNEDGVAQKITIQCKKCRSLIQLVGFEALAETGDLGYLDDYLGFRVDLENIK